MTKIDDPLLKLDNFLPYRFFVLASKISRSLAQHYEQQFNISRPQWRVIAVLGEQPDLAAAEVAARTAMDKVAVSRAVSKLLDMQLLERSFTTEDKRRSALCLSTKGKEIYQQVVPVALKYEQAILDQLTTEESQLLTQVLEKLDDIELDMGKISPKDGQ